MGNFVNAAVQDAVAAVKMVANDSNHQMEFVQESYGHGKVMNEKQQGEQKKRSKAFEMKFNARPSRMSNLNAVPPTA